VPHDAWLSELDPSAEGLAALQEPEFLATDPAAGAADLARVKELLAAHAGALQALLLLATADASMPPEGVNRMTLAQLKALLGAARVMGPGGVAADAVDRAFAAVQATPRALARKAESAGASAAALELPDFAVALVHVAHLRCALRGGRGVGDGKGALQQAVCAGSGMQRCGNGSGSGCGAAALKIAAAPALPTDVPPPRTENRIVTLCHSRKATDLALSGWATSGVFRMQDFTTLLPARIHIGGNRGPH
jgi:hypothetical protein